ncbi:MAG: glycosyltransferase family 2 protein [Chloroflexi bacterium]|nr:glycosyltransferase family 2 protein [Chloroflexota bacterium]
MSSDKKEHIDIVIPVYNEGENILSLLNAFDREVNSDIRILLCYDHDDDTTLKALKGVHSRFEIIPVKNQGKFAHGAVLTGFQYSTAPAVISYMADDDYNAGKIDKMIDLFWQGRDIVCASRFIPGGSMVGCPWPKEFFVRAVSFSLFHLGRLPAHDATNAFRLFSRRLLNQVKIESNIGFTYSLELLAKCHRLGLRVAEIPAQWFERLAGSSRFQVFSWAPAYLKWYFYIYATTYFFRRKP